MADQPTGGAPSPGTQSASAGGGPSAPSISLPKGGGAIRGIGEKFGVDAATGTGSFSIPIATSAGRGGFGPKLSLSYDSGSGNGAFGVGFSLGLPAITRKTDKGIPRYVDSDVFVLSGSEDLVPVRDESGARVEDRESHPGFVVERYRPRIEGLFSRIERWTAISTGAVHWRTITRDNTTTLFGTSESSRIADPSDPRRVFRWLIAESRDDEGNGTVYEYVAENDAGVEPELANERKREHTANRYLKRIRYGNRVSHRLQPELAASDFLFEVVFDYDEGHVEEVPLDPARPAAEQHRFALASEARTRPWARRPDPFSSYRAGFEIRTHRRCRRVLMFHHIPDLPTGELGYRGLVQSTEFDYADLDLAGGAVSVADELAHQGSTRFASFIRRIVQSGYVRDDARAPALRGDVELHMYLRESFPPLELTYSRAVIDDTLREVDLESLENAPTGLHGAGAHFVDLHGEGSAGILVESAGAWYYKRNVSPLGAQSGVGAGGAGRPRSTTQAAFAPLELVHEKPTAQLAEGAQLTDVVGDGLVDVVVLDGPLPGVSEHDDDEGWHPFRAFAQRLNRGSRDPNVQLVDLDGDGRADVMITEYDAIVWHPSLGRDGFGPAERVANPFDEERGPRLVFADGTDSIHLADMSGDGLADLVRVRNGEVCYWPSLGHGRFGAKVTLDHAPLFDLPEQFDPKRVRLADVDGLGTNDVVYLGADGARLYLNQSGNRLSDARPLPGFPLGDHLASVVAVDLLGNGTSCLAWSTSLPGSDRRSLRYIDLMGGEKPHLLVRVVNNLGADAEIHYAPSTLFYLEDLRAGRPWVTKLPFPVHVVERIVNHDRISGNLFVTRYRYHHGHFDGVEREFRGFGMVDQLDTETFEALAADGALPDTFATNVDAASHVPPVLTKTWFHTGVHAGRDRVSRTFEAEYYREPGLDDHAAHALLLDDTVLPDGLSAEAEREACRALKGSILRQEVYALDGTDREPHPYTISEQNVSLRMLQAPRDGESGVFVAHGRESLSYHYDRRPHDPRIGHSLTLEADAFGNVLRSATIAYGRREPDPALTPDEQTEQARLVITCTENRVTNAVDGADAFRTPLLAESRSFELTGLPLPTGRARFAFDEVLDATRAATIAYEATPTEGALEKRLIEHVRSYYRRDDLTGALPLGELEPLGLPFESYKLAFTPALATELFEDRVTAAMLAEGGYVATEGEPGHFLPSGRVFYSPGTDDDAATELAHAVENFFLPFRWRDPFHTAETSTEAVVSYDHYRLLVEETRDALGNRVTVGERDVDPTQPLRVRSYDYRTLQPALVMDANRNRSEVAFDAHGFVVGTAVMGKPEDDPVPGDRLGPAFRRDLTEAERAAVLADPTSALARELLGTATARTVYDLLAYARDPDIAAPVVAASFVRETHASDVPAGAETRIQVTLAYSDGFAREIQTKTLAEPGPVPERDGEGRIVLGPDGAPTMSTDSAPRRFIGSGWTVFDNKGQAVRKYEPFFTDTHRFEHDVRIGVSGILFYDPIGRAVATLHPNHTWRKIVADPWRREAWDENDTATIADPASDPDVGAYFARLPDAHYLPTWHALRTDPAHEAALTARYPSATDRSAQRRAALKTAMHAATPKVAYADSLGRTFLSIVHNRFKYSNAPEAAAPTEERHRNRTRMDVEGNPREVIDALGRVVMRYAYDMLGRRARQASMEQGTRFLFGDVAGQSLYLWDARGHRLHSTYDALRRPLETTLDDATASQVVSRALYGETRPDPEAQNLRGRQVELFDQAGVVFHDAYDFKGNLLRTRRRLARAYDATLDWSGNVEPLATYTSATRYNAINRPIQVIVPHEDAAGAPVHVVQPTHDQSGRVQRVDAWLERDAEPVGPLDRTTADLHAVTHVEYDARGQRERVEHGNRVRTSYAYDPLTRRLARLVTRRNPETFAGDCPDPAPDGWPGCQVQSLHYASDPVGNVTEIRDAAQQAIFFRNQRVYPVAEYTYDATYRLIEATGREHLGQVGGAPIPHSYGDAARIGRSAPTDGRAMGRYVERYVYDAVTNLLEMQHRGTDFSRSGWTRTFEYDEASQLDASQRSNRLTRTRVGDTPETYSTEGDGYDAHGNALRMPHLSAMEWDYKDQLRMSQRQAIAPDGDDGVARDGEHTFYVYDSAGRRVRKVTELASGALKDERIYLDGFEIYRRHGADPLTRETLHVMEDGRRVALVETRTEGSEPGVPRRLVRYQYGNHLGSVSLELDDAGDVVSYEEYTPYGSTSYQAVRSQLAAPKRYRFADRERDDESGFGYHGARYYMPWLGRFASADPAALADGPNLYAYAHGNPIVRLDASGLDDVVIYHRTTEAGAASMVSEGVRTDMSGSHVWAGGGFYGSGSPEIGGNMGARGDTIVAQSVSSDHMTTITDDGFIRMQQDTPRGLELRRLVRSQMRDRAATDMRTSGRRPSDADVDRYMRDYMASQMDRLAPGADVVRWQNTDGTFTYVVRRTSALRGSATIAGHMRGGRFHSIDAPHPHTRRTTPDVDAPHAHAPRTHTPDVPRGRRGRGGGTIGRIIMVGVAVYVYLDTGSAYAAAQTANPVAATTDAIVEGDTSAGRMAESVASDAYQATPVATVDGVIFGLLGPDSPLRPEGPRVYDQSLADRALREGRNPFCAQCHGPGGALDPAAERERQMRERPIVMPSFPTTPTDEAALREFIESMRE